MAIQSPVTSKGHDGEEGRQITFLEDFENFNKCFKKTRANI